MMNIAVLGASANPERMSHQAVLRLAAAGHQVYPVHPALTTLLGRKVYPSLREVPGPLDLLTVYVGQDRSTALADEILAVHPLRILFNPGAENPDLSTRAAAAGITVENACTLVLLSQGEFD